MRIDRRKVFTGDAICRLHDHDPLEALVGETPRLRERMQQFFDRLETQLRQILREGEARGDARLALPINAGAAFILAVIEGRINQFVRSQFQRGPADEWEVLWETIQNVVLQLEE